MECVRLGSAGLKVSRLCLGMMTYGSSQWRPWVLNEEQSRPFIRRALDLGIENRQHGSVPSSQERKARMAKESPVNGSRLVAPAGGACLLILAGALIAAQKPEVPVVDGHVGACSATFTVTDSGKKPVYDAKINVVIRYGFAGLHKTELQVGTNSDGKARVAGLPERVKKPLEFVITKGELSKTIQVDPAAKCDGNFEVTLGVP